MIRFILAGLFFVFLLIVVEALVRRFLPKIPPGFNFCPKCGAHVPFTEFSAHYKACK
jgi:hypothetical protein